MYSTAEQPVVERHDAESRTAEPQVRRDTLPEHRAIVKRTAHGWSIELIGKDPETRYLVEALSFWDRISRRFQLGRHSTLRKLLPPK